MALDKFWGDVKRAWDVYHSKDELVPNLWLVPHWVRRYDPADVAFLPDEGEALTAAVQDFRRWAAVEPATRDAVEGGGAQLRRIVELLELDRHPDAETFRVGKLVVAAVGRRLPGWVKDVRFETGTNSVGQPAVWVWVTTADDAPDDRAVVQPVEQLLEDTVHELTPEYWPYVSFRTVSEVAELDAVAT